MFCLSIPKIYLIIFECLLCILVIDFVSCSVDFFKSLDKYKNDTIHVRDKLEKNNLLSSWSTWSVWSACAGECNHFGYQVRHRSCIETVTTNNEVTCSGNSQDIRSCHLSGCSPEKYETLVKSDPVTYIEYNFIKGIHKDHPELLKKCLTHPCKFETVHKFLKEKSVRYWSALLCVKYGTSCPVRGEWNKWTIWSSCTAKCGEGKRFRYRECNKPVPSGVKYDCIGEESEIEKCVGIACQSIQGRWSSWSSWSSCSARCGFGIMRKYRTCKKLRRHERGLHYNVDNMLKLLNFANIFNHHVFKNIGSHKLFNDIVNTTIINNNTFYEKNGKNNMRKMLKYIGEQIHQKVTLRINQNTSTVNKMFPTEKSAKRLSDCNEFPLPTNSMIKVSNNEIIKNPLNTSLSSTQGKTVSTYSYLNYSTISVFTCSFRNKIPSREVSIDETKNTVVSSISKKRIENYAPSSSEKTYTKIPVNPTTISRQTCNSNNLKSTYRDKLIDSVKHKCVGPFKIFQTCRLKDCPVDGGWSDWSSWSVCSVHCGQGTQIRFRSCSNPHTQHGGRMCHGDTSFVRQCCNAPCEVLVHDYYKFSGNSYVTYDLDTKRNLLLHIYLKFKPVSFQGEIIFGYDNQCNVYDKYSDCDFYKLSLIYGKLFFTSSICDCKLSIISNNQLSMNEWHEMLLTVTGEYVKMRIDDSETTNTALFSCRPKLAQFKHSIVVGKTFNGFIQWLIINFVQFNFDKKPLNSSRNVMNPTNAVGVVLGQPDIEDSFISLNQLIRVPCPTSNSHWMIELAILPETTLGQLLYMRGKQHIDYLVVTLEINKVKLLMHINNTNLVVEDSEEIVPNKWLYIIINKIDNGSVSLKVNGARAHSIVFIPDNYTQPNIVCVPSILIGCMPFKLKLNMASKNPNSIPAPSIIGKLGFLKIDGKLFDLHALYRQDQTHSQMLSSFSTSNAGIYKEKIMIMKDVIKLNCFHGNNQSKVGVFKKENVSTFSWSKLSSPIVFRANASDGIDYFVNDDEKIAKLQFSSHLNRQAFEGFYSCFVFDSNRPYGTNRITYGLIMVDINQDYLLPLLYRLIIIKAYLTVIYFLLWCIYQFIKNVWFGEGFWKSRKLNRWERNKRMECMILSDEGRFLLGSEAAVITALDRLLELGSYDCATYFPGLEEKSVLTLNADTKSLSKNVEHEIKTEDTFYNSILNANADLIMGLKPDYFNKDNYCFLKTFGYNLNLLDKWKFESNRSGYIFPGFEKTLDVNFKFTETDCTSVFHFGLSEVFDLNDTVAEQENEEAARNVKLPQNIVPVPYDSNSKQCDWNEPDKNLSQKSDNFLNDLLLHSVNSGNIKFPKISDVNLHEPIKLISKPKSDITLLNNTYYCVDNKTKYLQNETINKFKNWNKTVNKELHSNLENNSRNNSASFTESLKKLQSFHNENLNQTQITKSTSKSHLVNNCTLNMKQNLRTLLRKKICKPHWIPGDSHEEINLGNGLTKESTASSNIKSISSLLQNTRINSKLLEHKVTNSRSLENMKKTEPTACDSKDDFYKPAGTSALDINNDLDLLNESIKQIKCNNSVIEDPEIFANKCDITTFDKSIKPDINVSEKSKRININESFCTTLLQAKEKLKPTHFSLNDISTIFDGMKYKTDSDQLKEMT